MKSLPKTGANLRNKTIRCINLPELLILIKNFKPYRSTAKRIFMKVLNVFDLDNDNMFSRKALRKILRPDEDNFEQRDIWQLIETFGFPKPIYRYVDNEVYGDNENMYSKAVEHFFKKFHPECVEKATEGDVQYRLLSCDVNICAAMFVCEDGIIQESFCFWVDVFSLPDDFYWSLGSLELFC